jgi:hypothetical protein
MMADMTIHMLFRKHHKSILAFVILIAYLCFVVRFTKDPRSLVIFLGLAVLAIIFFFPWTRRDDMSK